MQEIHRHILGAGELRAPLKVQEIVDAARAQRGIELPQALVQLDPDLADLATYHVPLRCLVSEGVKATVTVTVKEAPPPLPV